MSGAYVWTVIAGLGIATFLIRFSFIGFLAGRRLPPVVMEALSFVPVTVLPAIIAPMVLMQEGALTADPQRIAAAAVALAIGAAARNMLAAILGGMAVFVGWGLIF